MTEASAELAEYSKVAQFGRRPLLRKPMALSASIAFAAVLGAAIRVHRFFVPLPLAESMCLLRNPLEEVRRRTDLRIAPEFGVRDEPHVVIGHVI